MGTAEKSWAGANGVLTLAGRQRVRLHFAFLNPRASSQTLGTSRERARA